MPDEDLQILRRRVKDAHDNMSKMQRRIEMLEDDLSAQNHENNALILRIKDYEEVSFILRVPYEMKRSKGTALAFC